jgi:hypothetical protein
MDVVRLASRFGRYGYRQITNLLRIKGWHVNHKRMERIWCSERECSLLLPMQRCADTIDHGAQWSAIACPLMVRGKHT